MIRWMLDSVEYTAPMKYREIKLVHKRDEAIRGLMYGFNASVQFYGDAYDYLRSQYDASNCGWVEVDIEEKAQLSSTWNTLAEARIYMNEIEWDIFRNIATCKLTDRSFNSMIASNKNVKGYCNVPLSKVGDDITGFEATAFNLDLFDCSTGVYTTTGKAYKVYDVLKWSVAFMTNGNVGFDSVSFGVGGEFEFFAIASGLGLRGFVDEPAPYLSFQELYSDLAKLFNLSFYIDEVGGIWTIRIEAEETTFADTSSTAINGLYDVKESLYEDKFYANVKAGSATTQTADGGTYLYPDIRLMSHKQEEYNTQIECNLDTTLDLACKTLVTDSNVFDHFIRVDPTDDKYDDKNFIIHYYDNIYTGTFQAVQSTLVDSGGTVIVYYYNDTLMNERVCNRWTRHIPEGLASYYATGDYTCVARDSGNTQTAGSLGSSYSPGLITYDTEISDPGGVFNTATSFYEVPADGIYTFRVNARLLFTTDWPFGVYPVNFQVVFRRWDATVSTVLYEECINTSFTINATTGAFFAGIPNGTTIRIPNLWITMYLTSGDRIGVYCENFSGPANYGLGTGFAYGVAVDDAVTPDPTKTYNIDNATFACTWFSTGGGNIVGSATEYLRVRLHEFEKCIEKSKYQDIVNFPLSAIALGLPSGTIPAYVEQFEWNPVNKKGKFKLLSSTSTPL